MSDKSRTFLEYVKKVGVKKVLVGARRAEARIERIEKRKEVFEKLKEKHKKYLTKTGKRFVRGLTAKKKTKFKIPKTKIRTIKLKEPSKIISIMEQESSFFKWR